MKIKQILFMSFFLFLGIKAFSQCVNCANTENIISSDGEGIYTSLGAQAYFWEICEGNAVIVGSNTSQSVSINCQGSGISKIKVTRFVKGNCLEACRPINCNTSPVNCVIDEGKPICNSRNLLISRGLYDLFCGTDRTNADWVISISNNGNINNFFIGNFTNTSRFKPYLINYSFYGPITIKAYIPNTNIEIASINSFIGACIDKGNLINKAFIKDNFLILENPPKETHKVQIFNLYGALLEEFLYSENKEYKLNKALKNNNNVYLINLFDSNNKVLKQYKILK